MVDEKEEEAAVNAGGGGDGGNVDSDSDSSAIDFRLFEGRAGLVTAGRRLRRPPCGVLGMGSGASLCNRLSGGRDL